MTARSHYDPGGFAPVPPATRQQKRAAARALATVAGDDVEGLRIALLTLGLIEPPGEPAAVDVEHGTYARYMRHRRAGEPICDPCRAAKNAYQHSRTSPRSAAA